MSARALQQLLILALPFVYVTLTPPAVLAQGTPAEILAQLRLDFERRNPGRVPELTPEQQAALPAFLRQHMGKHDAASLRGVRGGAVVAVRCNAGYVVQPRRVASAPDVEFSSEQMFDCDPRGCRAFRLSARRSSDQAFDLDVSVTCSG